MLSQSNFRLVKDRNKRVIRKERKNGCGRMVEGGW